MACYTRLTPAICVAALIAPSVAQADVTAQQVWEDWQSDLALWGTAELQVGAETMDGDTLTVNDVKITMVGPDATAEATLPEVRFTETGDGTVVVTASESYPLTLVSTAPDAPESEVAISVTQTGLEILVSGTPENTVYDISADRYALTLDQVSVTDCVMTTDSPDFWQGGAGIYNGDGASLDLIDSTVADNTSGHDGGGVMSFFNTQTNVVRSTISGNTATNVGGGLRILGDGTISNSTISGNTSTAWHGGAMFLTDGVVDVDHTTVAGNVSPGGTAALFVGTFGPSSATMNIGTSVVSAPTNCFLAPFGAGAVAINSLGENVFTDGTCFPVGSDQVVADALIGPLADNGGPTLTHALLAGSPAVDAAPAAACPATDQRGVTRPQGAACDAGAFELE